ncbi:MAG: restriction endonuclease [Comamonadaceae bacterium CG12_big_fil_rev_8_21_14_0_65_59_15]|nr:MAG: restriction endonuclease [Comamonadaceae bacterium CG12_big_fil_rev_8_21_14_0_65_59_15]
MDGLRTVTVLEHEVIPIVEEGCAPDGDTRAWLSEVEAQALLRLNDLRRGFCQRLSGGVKLAQYCGIVRLATCVLEVLPKVGMDDARTADELEHSRGALLAMLHSAHQVIVTKVGAVPQQSVRAPLLDIFIEAFLLCALDQARRGMLSRYVSHADDLPVVKGRFHAHGHIRSNLARPHLLHCEYDEFTSDNPYNHAIRATLDACGTWVRRATTKRLWFETHARYASVSPVRMSTVDVARLPRDRTTRRYETVLTWCEWLLAMNSPALSAGVTQTPGLLFDMNKLFEAYVSGLEEAKTGDTYIVHRQGPVKALASQGDAPAFLLKPDITIWNAAPDGSALSISRVLDAKWKRLDPQGSNWGVDQSDVYQLLAYAIRYRCRKLELIYPMLLPTADGNTGNPNFTILVPGGESDAIEVCVKTVPLWRTSESGAIGQC